MLFFVVPLFPTVSWDNDDLWWKPLPSRESRCNNVSRRSAHATSHWIKTRRHVLHTLLKTRCWSISRHYRTLQTRIFFYQPVNMHENDDWLDVAKTLWPCCIRRENRTATGACRTSDIHQRSCVADYSYFPLRLSLLPLITRF